MKINISGLRETVTELMRTRNYLQEASKITSSIIKREEVEDKQFLRKISNDIDGIIYNIGGILEGVNEIIANFKEAQASNATVVEKTVASAGNTVSAVVKGIGKVFEGIGDWFITSYAYAVEAEKQSMAADTNFARNFDKSIPEYNPKYGETIEAVMPVVAEEHVENAFKNFYEDTKFGRTLDKWAYEPFKSDGMAYEAVGELSYVATIALTGPASPFIAGMAGTGRYTEEAWAGKRDSSWEGFVTMYENGEISAEVYNSYLMIRGMSNKVWQSIVEDYENGIIEEETYNAMKQIREMPEEWTTLENANEGVTYGLANGIWEGLQWYVGTKLAYWTIKGHPMTPRVTRIITDTAFNALDTPYRALLNAGLNDMSYEEAFIAQGGWWQIAIDAGIGLIGSTTGEIIDVAKTKKINKILNNTSLYEGIDDINTKKIQQQLADMHAKGIIDLNKMSDADLKIRVDRLATYYEIEPILKSEGLFEGIDDINRSKIQDQLINEQVNGEINMFLMTEEGIKARVNKLDSLYKAEARLKSSELYEGIDDINTKKIQEDLLDRHNKGEINLENIPEQKLKEMIKNIDSFKGTWKAEMEVGRVSRELINEANIEANMQEIRKILEGVENADEIIKKWENNGFKYDKEELDKLLEKIEDIDDASRLKLLCSDNNIMYSQREQLKIDNFYDQVEKTVETVNSKQGIYEFTEEDIASVLVADKKNREKILSSILSEKYPGYEVEHLENHFSDGAIKFAKQSAIKDGQVAGFVTDINEIYDILKNTNANDYKSILEQKLSTSKGYFDEAGVIIYNENVQLEIPKGSEFSAWIEQWRPGGYTENGVAEATTVVNHNGYLTNLDNEWKNITLDDLKKYVDEYEGDKDGFAKYLVEEVFKK